MGVPKDKVLSCCRLLRAGHREPPAVRELRLPAAKDREQFQDVDGFFHQLYLHYAEPWATEPKSSSCPAMDAPMAVPGWDLSLDTLKATSISTMEEIHVSADHPFMLACAGADGSCLFVDERTLPPDTGPAELYEMYKAENGTASKETLRCCWVERWKKFMPVRSKGQGGRCQICAEITQARKIAVTEEDKTVLAFKKKEHVETVMAITTASR